MIKKFTVDVEMDARWVNQFASFLKTLERDGAIGYSEEVCFYADGDGDFNPTFKINTPYLIEPSNRYFHGHALFDAG